MSKKFRTNQKITVPTVRLIDDKGEQQGIVAIEKAQSMADAAELDLVEVAPKANPPVCKIMDYGKFQYAQKKIDAKHRKMQKKKEIKGVRIGFKTSDNDIMTKAKQAYKFLDSGNLVKVTLIFRGREAMYKDLAAEKMMKLYAHVEEVGDIETKPKKQGHTLIMLLTPKK